MTILEQLAAWLVEQRSGAARASMGSGTLAHARALDAVRDTIACMVAGAGDEGAHAVRKTALGYGRGDCTVVGELDKALAPFAAMANGMSAHVLDYDDNYSPGLTHALGRISARATRRRRARRRLRRNAIASIHVRP